MRWKLALLGSVVLATTLDAQSTSVTSAHSVSVDVRTHRIYLALENVGGHPALRVLEPSAPSLR